MGGRAFGRAHDAGEHLLGVGAVAGSAFTGRLVRGLAMSVKSPSTVRHRPLASLRSADHRSREFPDRASPLMCRTGGAGIGVARLPESLRWLLSGDAPGSTPSAAAIDAASACGRATTRHDLDDRSQQRLLGAAAGASPSPPCAGPNLQPHQRLIAVIALVGHHLFNPRTPPAAPPQPARPP